MSQLTAEQIAKAKAECNYSSISKQHHENDDCIRIAYNWLDAQIKFEKPQPKKHLALKHIIEKWGGRYVSQSDVDVAAHLHPDVKGSYPNFNLSTKRVIPRNTRLDDIPQAKTMSNYSDNFTPDTYKLREGENGEVTKLNIKEKS